MRASPAALKICLPDRASGQGGGSRDPHPSYGELRTGTDPMALVDGRKQIFVD